VTNLPELNRAILDHCKHALINETHAMRVLISVLGIALLAIWDRPSSDTCANKATSSR
jgi:hypothetical protein